MKLNLLSIASLLLIFLTSCGVRHIKRDDLGRLKLGMSTSEVSQILGKPIHVYNHQQNLVIYTYNLNQSNRGIPFIHPFTGVEMEVENVNITFTNSKLTEVTSTRTNVDLKTFGESNTQTNTQTLLSKDNSPSYNKNQLVPLKALNSNEKITSIGSNPPSSPKPSYNERTSRPSYEEAKKQLIKRLIDKEITRKECVKLMGELKAQYGK